MQRRSFVRSILLPEEGWLSFAFLCGVILSSVWSVEAANWVDHLSILTWATLLAVGVGFLLAKIRLPGLLLHPLGLALGVAVSFYLTAGTLPAAPLRRNVVVLWDHLERWVNITASGGISTDNLLFLLLLASIVWLMGYYGAWSVFRAHGPWWVILTSGSILIVNLSYARSLDIFALLYLLTAMLLIMRLNVAVQEESWQRSGVQYSAGFAWQFLRSSLLAGVVIVFATWLTPSTLASQHLTDAWTQVSGPWQNAEAEFSRLFGGLRAKDQIGMSGFGKTLALRGASSLSDTPVLAEYDQEPRYLRGVVYDRYTGQGWLAPEWASELLLPNDPRLEATGDLLLRAEVTSTIKVLQPRGTTVVAPAQPLRVSLPVVAEYDSAAQRGDVDVQSAYVDVGVLRNSVMMRRGQQYVAVSSISRADVKSLREAGTQYPDWVKQRYLSLPRTVPGRVFSLARRIAQGAVTPYDRAVAIQNFLRTYPYSDSVPAPPPGRDAVEYFLFDAKIGYCDYYASAMVVMLRQLGVPARVVSGYSPGEYDAGQGAYVVRDANAHSWPEVYFPRYGWVEFEPTASRPLPVRPDRPPAGDEAAGAPATVDQSAGDDLDPSLMTPDEKERGGTPAPGSSGDEPPLLTIARLALPLLVLLFIAYRVALVFWQRAFRELGPAEAAYAKLSLIAAVVGLGRPPPQTPFEHGRRLTALVPEGGRDVQFIVERFVRLRFGRKLPAAGEEQALEGAWRNLRRLLLPQLWRRLRLRSAKSADWQRRRPW